MFSHTHGKEKNDMVRIRVSYTGDEKNLKNFLTEIRLVAHRSQPRPNVYDAILLVRKGKDYEYAKNLAIHTYGCKVNIVKK